MMIKMRRWCASALLALVVSPALLPTVASAQEEPPCGELLAMLDAGAPAGDAVRASLVPGFTLSQAAVYTLVCGGEEHRVDIAFASVMMSGNMVQAQSVATALLRTAGQTGTVAEAVDRALRQYASGIPQPGIHEDSYTPHGGGVSPAY